MGRAFAALSAAIERARDRGHSLADAALDECRSECLFAQSWLRAAQQERNHPTDEPPPCAECGTNLVRGECPKPELHQ